MTQPRETGPKFSRCCPRLVVRTSSRMSSAFDKETSSIYPSKRKRSVLIVMCRTARQAWTKKPAGCDRSPSPH